MASAQAMEEELQQSVMLSDEDAAYETADTAEEGSTINAVSDAIVGPAIDDVIGQPNEDENLSDRDASGEEIEEEDEDAEGEEDDDPRHQNPQLTNGTKKEDDSEDEADDEEEDAEGDVDAEGEDVEDAEGEGVGAVKVKPGESHDEEDDEDAESDISDAPSNAEDDSSEEEEDEEAAAWDDPVAGEEDEESEAGPTNICVFCKQSEENDPSEDFEAFLSCSGCGDNGGTFSQDRESDANVRQHINNAPEMLLL